MRTLPAARAHPHSLSDRFRRSWEHDGRAGSVVFSTDRGWNPPASICRSTGWDWGSSSSMICQVRRDGAPALRGRRQNRWRRAQCGAGRADGGRSLGATRSAPFADSGRGNILKWCYAPRSTIEGATAPKIAFGATRRTGRAEASRFEQDRRSSWCVF